MEWLWALRVSPSFFSSVIAVAAKNAINLLALCPDWFLRMNAIDGNDQNLGNNCQVQSVDDLD